MQPRQLLFHDLFTPYFRRNAHKLPKRVAAHHHSIGEKLFDRQLNLWASRRDQRWSGTNQNAAQSVSADMRKEDKMKSMIQKLMTASLALAVVSGGLVSTAALAKKKKIGMVTIDSEGHITGTSTRRESPTGPTSSDATQGQSGTVCNPKCPPADAQQVKPKPGQSEPTRPKPE